MNSRAEPLRILAFDLALVTGWALCEYMPTHPDYFHVFKSGIIDCHVRKEPSPLEEGTYVRRLYKFGRALDAVVLGYLEYIHRVEQKQPVGIIAYELASWRAKKGTSTKVREMALRLSGVLLEHLWYLQGIEIDIARVAPQSWQAFVFGDKYKVRQSSVERKKLSIEHCRALGYRPETHHEADAVCIAYYVARRKLDEKVS